MATQCCRGCLMELSPNEVYSFQWPGIKESFENCTNLKVPCRRPEDQQLPQGLCSLCYAQCEQWKKFRKMCHEIDRFIHSSSFPKERAEPDPAIDDEEFEGQSEEELFSEETESEIEDVKPFISGKLDSSFSPMVIVERLNLDHLRSKKLRNLRISGLKKCPICSKMVPSLFHHLAEHIQSGQKRCQICSLDFNDRTNLKFHMVVHTDEKPFACKICHKKFTRVSTRNSHTENRHNLPRRNAEKNTIRKDRPVQINAKNTSRLSQRKPPKTISLPLPKPPLANHHPVEVKVEKKKCPICPRTVRSLVLHLMEVHVQPGRLDCPLCRTHHDSNTRLRRHLLVHTREQFYVCKACHRPYGSALSLKQHIVLMHPERTEEFCTKVKQECGVCDQTFISALEFDAHVRQHDEKEIEELSRRTASQANRSSRYNRRVNNRNGGMSLRSRR